MVGLLPLAAVAIFEEDILEKLPDLHEKRAKSSWRAIPNSAPTCTCRRRPAWPAGAWLSTVNETNCAASCARMLDENEFFGPHGIRALSRATWSIRSSSSMAGRSYRVSYLPGDSDSGMFGGNSNWRGPVWMPVNMMLYVALLRLAAYYGDSFKVECPTGSGNEMTLFEVAHDLAERLIGTFLRNSDGRRPVFGGTEKFQTDPHWRDYILFYEYFHGDNGAGIGASHQTGWTGCIARIIQVHGLLTKEIISSLRASSLEPSGPRVGGESIHRRRRARVVASIDHCFPY